MPKMPEAVGDGKKVLVIGTGYIGAECTKQMAEKGFKVLTARRSEGADVQLDITKIDSVLALNDHKDLKDGVDHVMVVAGHSTFGDVTKFNAKMWYENFESKLLCCTRLAVLLLNGEELRILKDGGSVTITSGLAARTVSKLWPAVAANCAGIDAFTRCAGVEPPRGCRLNAVALTTVAETAAAVGKSTEGCMSSAEVATAYVESALGTMSGEVFTRGKAGAPSSFGTAVFDHLHKKRRTE
eukprot:TRINITY_DN124785_c0_g1_i1.p1 TRINITY_DN124785_c0_g1~~TRINITY_DN124785_c0_g1_i1.p1  ORF type:complete len:241 (-),score=49.72 TRINITY_DN124785_c0_g1_i1:172-894(-)